MMKPRITTALICLLALVGTQIASADSFYYESVTTTRGEKEKKGSSELIRGWVDGVKVRIEFPQGGQGGRVGEGNYMLTTDGGSTVYMVSPKEKSYFAFDIANLMGSLGEMTGGMVNIEFRDFSAEKLSEGAGGSVMGHDTKRFKVRTQLTMEMNAMGMQRVSKVDATQDAWMAGDLRSDAWSMWLKMMPSGGAADQFSEWASASGLTEGFPLKTSSTTTITNRKGKAQTSISEMEVTVLREEPIAASIFEIPADYQEAEMVPPELGGTGAEESEGPMKALKGMFGRKNKKKDGGS
jgi:hypothetical protein